MITTSLTMNMNSPRMILLVIALVLVILSAVGHCPLWVPVLLINLALILPLP